MRVGLFSYHADFATAEYFSKVIVRDGHELLRIGLRHPERGKEAAPPLSDLVSSRGLDMLLFVDPPGPFWPMGWEKLPCPTIGYLIDVHQTLDIRLAYAPFFDKIYVAQRDYVEEFRSRGLHSTEWLPLGCDPETHSHDGSNRSIDVGFVGKLGPRGSDRHVALHKVLQRYQTNDYRLYYAPTEMGRLYSHSKIVFNKSINGDLNMRVFEAMAAGALLVTDRIRNGFSDLFCEGVHYVGYSSIDEAISRIDYFLAHGQERTDIAARGRSEVLRNHTYSGRWNRVRDSVLVATEPARVRTMNESDLMRAYSRVYEILKLPSGVIRVIRLHGINCSLFFSFLKAFAKLVNATIPITPGAIRSRLRS